MSAQSNDFDRGQTRADAHAYHAPVDPFAASHLTSDSQKSAAGGDSLPPTHRFADTHTSGGGGDYSLLALLSSSLDEYEAVRIAQGNRLYQLGQMLPPNDPIFLCCEALLAQVEAIEHGAVLELQRTLRRVPLGPWVKATAGVGEKQGARLLASTGDPYWNSLHGRPRTVSELWAYCGLHVLHPGQRRFEPHMSDAGVDPSLADQKCYDLQSGTVGESPSSDLGQVTLGAHAQHAGVAASRQRGQRANWSADAKSRVWLIASTCIVMNGAADKNGKARARSPYRDVYDEGRAKYADAVHNSPCKRCGPSGSPAVAGSPLSDGHKHARAIRLVMKAILRDMWIESRRLHHDIDPHKLDEAAGPNT